MSTGGDQLRKEFDAPANAAQQGGRRLNHRATVPVPAEPHAHEEWHQGEGTQEPPHEAVHQPRAHRYAQSSRTGALPPMMALITM